MVVETSCQLSASGVMTARDADDCSIIVSDLPIGLVIDRRFWYETIRIPPLQEMPLRRFFCFVSKVSERRRPTS